MRVSQRGQVTAELAVLFAFVIGGFVAMGFYLQRGVQGSTRANADSVGTQFSTTSGWTSYSASDSHEAGAEVRATSCSHTEHGIGQTVTAATDCRDALPEATTAQVAATVPTAP